MTGREKEKKRGKSSALSKAINTAFNALSDFLLDMLQSCRLLLLQTVKKVTCFWLPAHSVS